MNSPFAKIFTALQAYITAQVPAIVYIDLDYGQLETKDRPAVSFPCILIDFPAWTFTDLSNLVQQGSGNIMLKLATDPYTSTSNVTPDTYKEAGLNILELEYDLYKALEGIKIDLGNGKATSPLGRTNLDSDNRRPGLKVRPMTFTTSFQDYAAKRTTTIIAALPPDINGTLLSLPV